MRRFHDPKDGDYSPLSRSSSHESLDSLNISDKMDKNDFGRIMNTVKAIEQEGIHKGQAKTFQLPSLITPLSLYGKRIRYVIFLYGKKKFKFSRLFKKDILFWNMHLF